MKIVRSGSFQSTITTIVGLALIAIAVVSCDSQREPGAPAVIDPPGVVWGAETNGCRVGIEIRPTPADHSATVAVHFQLPPDANESALTNWMTGNWRAKYLETTNGFPGPIELRSAAGRKMTLRRPEVNSRRAYPQTYDIHYVQNPPFLHDHRLPRSWYLRSGARNPFLLTNYFTITDSGIYQLTISPRIYERSATNSILGVRMDLAPVTVTFEYRADPAK